jgi:hypothetical protein
LGKVRRTPRIFGIERSDAGIEKRDEGEWGDPGREARLDLKGI